MQTKPKISNQDVCLHRLTREKIHETFRIV